MKLPETMGDVERLMYSLVEKQAEVDRYRQAAEYHCARAEMLREALEDIVKLSAEPHVKLTAFAALEAKQ